MRNGTLPAMAGNPPADAAQPSGMNGMIVTLPMNDAQEPRAPRIPSPLCQNHRNKSRANDHSDTPSREIDPRTTNTGYIQEICGPLIRTGVRFYSSRYKQYRTYEY